MVAKSWGLLAALAVIVALGGCGGPEPSAGTVASAGGGGNGDGDGDGDGKDKVLVCPCKVTGGGFVFRDDEEEKTTFGFNAQALKDAEFNPDLGAFPAKGQFEINFHELDSKLHGTVDTIACFPQNGTVLVEFGGTLKSGGIFGVQVVDNGEPGVNDTIAFTGGGEDFNFDTLDLGGDGPGGGNIQLHKIDFSKCKPIEKPPPCNCPPCPTK